MPAEKNGACRAEVEVLLANVLPVQRKIVVEEREIFQRYGNLRVRIVALLRIEYAVRGAAIHAAIGADSRVTPAGASGLDVFDEANAVPDKILEVVPNWKRNNLFLTIND